MKEDDEDGVCVHSTDGGEERGEQRMRKVTAT